MHVEGSHSSKSWIVIMKRDYNNDALGEAGAPGADGGEYVNDGERRYEAVRTGKMTINQMRAESGKEPLDAPGADDLLVSTRQRDED